MLKNKKIKIFVYILLFLFFLINESFSRIVETEGRESNNQCKCPDKTGNCICKTTVPDNPEDKKDKPKGSEHVSPKFFMTIQNGLFLEENIYNEENKIIGSGGYIYNKNKKKLIYAWTQNVRKNYDNKKVFIKDLIFDEASLLRLFGDKDKRTIPDQLVEVKNINEKYYYEIYFVKDKDIKKKK
ncbi:MAG: hypothetical protein V1779_05710 [bacterium]